MKTSYIYTFILIQVFMISCKTTQENQLAGLERPQTPRETSSLAASRSVKPIVLPRDFNCPSLPKDFKLIHPKSFTARTLKSLNTATKVQAFLSEKRAERESVKTYLSVFGCYFYRHVEMHKEIRDRFVKGHPMYQTYDRMAAFAEEAFKYGDVIRLENVVAEQQEEGKLFTFLKNRGQRLAEIDKALSGNVSSLTHARLTIERDQLVNALPYKDLNYKNRIELWSDWPYYEKLSAYDNFNRIIDGFEFTKIRRDNLKNRPHFANHIKFNDKNLSKAFTLMTVTNDSRYWRTLEDAHAISWMLSGNKNVGSPLEINGQRVSKYFGNHKSQYDAKTHTLTVKYYIETDLDLFEETPFLPGMSFPAPTGHIFERRPERSQKEEHNLHNFIRSLAGKDAN